MYADFVFVSAVAIGSLVNSCGMACYCEWFCRFVREAFAFNRCSSADGGFTGCGIVSRRIDKVWERWSHWLAELLWS